jgi:carbamoyltransferase
VRAPDKLLIDFHMDVAASIQAVLDEVVLRITRSLAKKTGAKNLCLAGGVALNCVANGKVLRDGAFENIWIQPAAGDAGGAVGAALAAVHIFKGQPRKTNGGDGMAGALLGPSYGQSNIERRLASAGAHFEVLDEDRMIETTAKALAGQQAVRRSIPHDPLQVINGVGHDPSLLNFVGNAPLKFAIAGFSLGTVTPALR